MKHLIIDIPYGATIIAIPLTPEVLNAIPYIMEHKPFIHKHYTVYTTAITKNTVSISIVEVENASN